MHNFSSFCILKRGKDCKLGQQCLESFFADVKSFDLIAKLFKTFQAPKTEKFA